METVFKVGMKVYDQVFEPDIKGEVLDVNTEIPHHPITVLFGHNTCYYTAEGCRGQHKIRTLSTSPYTIQGFEQKAPTPTYEEALKEAHRKDEYYYLPNDLEAPSEELANATVALLKLLFLRDYYNEGWKPNWKDNGDKHCIILYKGEFTTIGYSFTFEVLHFKTKEIRDKFLEEQRELLEIAKPLL